LKRKVFFLGVFLLGVGIVAIFFSLVPIPFQEQEPYDVPKSSVLLEESLVVPAGQNGEISRTLGLNEGDVINIYFRVTSGGNLDVNFFFRDGVNTVFSLPRATNYNDTLTINNNSTYYAVWDNSFSTFTQKSVTTKISEVWVEVAYNDITVHHTIIPSAYTTITEYVGIMLILVGIFLIVYGYVSRETRNTTDN
jgi:hypothetical protein